MNALTVKDWFGPDTGAEVSLVTAADGAKLDAGITTLVSAMAAYQSTHAGFNPATAAAMPQDATLQNAVAAAWHG